jgi:hypothetical protein
MSEMRETDSDIERIPMQYLIIDAAQDPIFNHRKKHNGAQIGCWIKNQNKTDAYLIAKRWIEEQGWIVSSLEVQQPVTADKYQDNPEGRRYFEQALIEEKAFVFLVH